MAASADPPPADIAILTVIAPELDAARAALGLDPDKSRRKDKFSGTVFLEGSVSSNRSKRDVRVVLACVGGAGNPAASAAASEIVLRYQPKVVLLMGIAAGMRGKTKIGDVILSERVVAYEPAALVQEKDGSHAVQPRPEIDRAPHTIQQDLVHYEADVARIAKKFSRIGGIFPKAPDDQTNDWDKYVASAIRVQKGVTLAAGEKVLRDPTKLIELRRDMHGKIEVGEMEAAGLVEACRRHGIPWLVIRGISDFGDEFKHDGFHELASKAGAAVLVDFIEHGLELGNRSEETIGTATPHSENEVRGMAVSPAVTKSIKTSNNAPSLPPNAKRNKAYLMGRITAKLLRYSPIIIFAIVAVLALVIVADYVYPTIKAKISRDRVWYVIGRSSSGQPQAYHSLRADETNLYFIGYDAGESTIYTIAKNSDSDATFTQLKQLDYAVKKIDLDNENVYWRSNENNLMSMPKVGGSAQEIAKFPANDFNTTLDGGYFYWCDTPGIMRMPKTGGEITCVLPLDDTNRCERNLIVDSEAFFWSYYRGHETTILTVSRHTPGDITIIGSVSEDPVLDDLAVDESYVYAAVTMVKQDTTRCFVKRFARGGGKPFTLVDEHCAKKLVPVNDWLYYTTTNSVFRITKCGGVPRIVVPLVHAMRLFVADMNGLY
ncbi:MAG TPA: hypothetical protein PK156_33620, partial [Polyangium sp.]|nr:hypothetical protein [Polyangium sp.]